MALYPLAQVEEQLTGVGGRGMTYEEAKDILRVYCFNNDVLITVFPLPQKYRSTAQKIKRKERYE